MKTKTRSRMLSITGFVYENTSDGAHCEIQASVPMTCPLCKVLVPAETKHTCGTTKRPEGRQPLIDAVRAALKIHG